MNTTHKITQEKKEKRVIHPVMSERHNDVMKVITQKSQFNYKLKYNT